MASKRRLRRRQCGTKQQFNTKADADKAGAFGGNTTYQCDVCKKFHFGRPPKEVRIRNAKQRRAAWK